MDEWPEDPMAAVGAVLLGITALALTLTVGVVIGVVRGFLHRPR